MNRSPQRFRSFLPTAHNNRLLRWCHDGCVHCFTISRFCLYLPLHCLLCCRRCPQCYGPLTIGALQSLQAAGGAAGGGVTAAAAGGGPQRASTAAFVDQGPFVLCDSKLLKLKQVSNRCRRLPPLVTEACAGRI